MYVGARMIQEGLIPSGCECECVLVVHRALLLLLIHRVDPTQRPPAYEGSLRTRRL